jgi:hypothetical protein
MSADSSAYASRRKSERDREYGAAPLDQVYEALGYKLINVVVVAVVYAVDVLQVSAPACPLAVTYPTLSKRRHPDAISIQTIAEVEVLHLYLMLTSCYAINDVLVLADGGKG